MVVTTEAIRRAKLQSNCHHQQTNTRHFYSPNALRSPNQHWREGLEHKVPKFACCLNFDFIIWTVQRANLIMVCCVTIFHACRWLSWSTRNIRMFGCWWSGFWHVGRRLSTHSKDSIRPPVLTSWFLPHAGRHLATAHFRSQELGHGTRYRPVTSMPLSLFIPATSETFLFQRQLHG